MFGKGFLFLFFPVNNKQQHNSSHLMMMAKDPLESHSRVSEPCHRPVLTDPVQAQHWAALGSTHRLLARESHLSREERFLGGEWPTEPRAECRPRLEEWLLCFLELVSCWSWLWPGSLLPSFCSWSCSLWEGNVFLIVLIRNLLFVPARGHFIQPIGPIVSALVFPRFASFSNSSMAFLRNTSGLLAHMYTSFALPQVTEGSRE